MHQSWLCTAAPLSTLPSQSVLSFDHNVSVLQLHPFSSFLHKAVIVHIISCQMLLELKKRFVWLIFYQCTFGTQVRYRSLCRMQTLDPISTPLAWPIVWCLLYPLILHSRETPIRGVMEWIERRPVIGVSCYLLTTATQLAGPLFLQESGCMCEHVCLCVGLKKCLFICLWV